MKMNCALAFVIAGLLAGGPAIADKPSWAGSGKGEKSEKHQDKGKSENRKDRQRDADERSRRNRAGSSAVVRQHFEARHRTVVHDYDSDEFRRGRCPPGLVKKQNGCMPPGQARKWKVDFSKIRPLKDDAGKD